MNYAVPAGPFAALGEGRSVQVNTNHLSTAALARQIVEVDASGYDATAFRVDYYVKWAAPLGCIVLPALALFFAVGGPPFPSASLTVSLSVVTAVAFVLLTGVGTSLGYGGVLSPPVLSMFSGYHVLAETWFGSQTQNLDVHVFGG